MLLLSLALADTPATSCLSATLKEKNKIRDELSRDTTELIITLTNNCIKKVIAYTGLMVFQSGDGQLQSVRGAYSPKVSLPSGAKEDGVFYYPVYTSITDVWLFATPTGPLRFGWFATLIVFEDGSILTSKTDLHEDEQKEK